MDEEETYEIVGGQEAAPLSGRVSDDSPFGRAVIGHRAGDQVTMLTTAGFTAGLRYNMYRAEGLVSKDFLYTLFMDPENGLNMTVTVADATYPMSAEPTAEVYYYDLFTGNIETFEKTVQMFHDGVMQ